MRDGDLLDQHDPIRGGTVGVLIRNDLQRPTVLTAEHARKQPRSESTLSSTLPPSATRVQHRPGALAYQIASSASTQILSGAEPGPSSAQIRRSSRSPDAVIIQAVRRSAWDLVVHRVTA
jgi:hypothetical protein